MRRLWERPTRTLCAWRAANAATSKRLARTRSLSMRMNALNAAVRSVARRRLGPGSGSGTPDVPSEQAS